MFTGLVEEIGTIKEYKSIPDGKEAWIEGRIVIDDLKKDDSISCSGICPVSYTHLTLPTKA